MLQNCSGLPRMIRWRKNGADAADYAALVADQKAVVGFWSRPSFAGTPAPIVRRYARNLDVR